MVVIYMYCKRCGAALPSRGFICRRCGAMMSEEQIKEQKKFMRENKNDVYLKSDEYNNNTVKRDYKKRNENKYLGVIFIVLIVIILVIVAILKVM